MKIIKIGAMWCPGCLVMKKIWNNINSKYDLDIIELDYDMDHDKVLEYNCGDILPVVIFLDKDGIEIDRLVGEQKEENITVLIDKYRVK